MAMPSKDCYTRQSQTPRIELELKRDIYSEMSRYPGNHRSGSLPPGPRSTEKGATAGSIIDGQQESYRPKSWEYCSDGEKQPYSIPAKCL